MSKIFVVGDVHQHHETAEEFLEDWNGPVIFLGDYFDQFYDTPEDAANTARWLKNSLQQPNRIHLMGNHDFHYRIPIESGTFCSGYSPEKHRVISEILTREDWNKVKYFHAENNCWFSHAGVSYKWFSHPVLGINQEVVEKVIAKAQEDIEAQIYNTPNVGALWAADFYRGGRYDKGGILWCDWRCIDFFPGITQIVGHTPREEVKSHSRKGGTCINIDTHLQECIILDTETNSFEVVFKK
jgi:hypothetical protein